MAIRDRLSVNRLDEVWSYSAGEQRSQARVGGQDDGLAHGSSQKVDVLVE